MFFVLCVELRSSRRSGFEDPSQNCKADDSLTVSDHDPAEPAKMITNFFFSFHGRADEALRICIIVDLSSENCRKVM